MQIWVDADACPNAVKEVLFRAAQRTNTQLTLVANQYLKTPPSPLIRALQVPQGLQRLPPQRPCPTSMSLP